MNHKEPFSDDLLNAYIDSELDEQERELIFSQMHEDHDLARRVRELQTLKNLVHAARPSAECGCIKQAECKTSFATCMKLASVPAVLAAVLATGWWLAPAGINLPGGGRETLDAGIVNTEVMEAKLVMHFTRATPEAARSLLDRVEGVLASAAESGRMVRIEVIANGPGLYLLRRDQSPFPERIRRLKERYDNLLFAACNDTVKNIRRKSGVQVELLPDAMIVNSGKAQIKLRRSQGWKHIVV